MHTAGHPCGDRLTNGLRLGRASGRCAAVEFSALVLQSVGVFAHRVGEFDRHELDRASSHPVVSYRAF